MEETPQVRVQCFLIGGRICFFSKVSFKAKRGCKINYILEGKRYCPMNRESKGHKRLRDKAGS